MSSDDGEPVTLHLYDLTMGWAKKLSMSVIGKQLDGIWHSGISVFGLEYFWGGELVSMPSGHTVYGTPVKRIPLGRTHVPKELVDQFVEELRPRFNPSTYSLLSHNCNNFSNELSQFLTGSPIPPDVVGLPEEILSTPVGAALRPIILRIEEQSRAAYARPASAQPAISPTAVAAAAAAAAAAAVPITAAPPVALIREGNPPLVSSQGSCKPFIAKLRSTRKAPDDVLASLEAGTLPDPVFAFVDSALAEWTPEECAPLLFVLRGIATGAEWAKRLDGGKAGLVASIGRLVAAEHRTCCLLAMATAANTFASAPGATVMRTARACELVMIPSLSKLVHKDAAVRQMAAALAYNFSCSPIPDSAVADSFAPQLADALAASVLVLHEGTDPAAAEEAEFRSMLAIGGLILAHRKQVGQRLSENGDFRAFLIAREEERVALRLSRVAAEVSILLS